MIKAVIFDVDGVLVDSRDANVALFQSLLPLAGYPRPTREAVLAYFHLPLSPALEKLLGTQDKIEIQRVSQLVTTPGVRDSSLFKFHADLEHVLENLHQQYRLAIVTSRIKGGMEDIFSVKEIKQLFNVVVTFEDYQHHKPHPEPLLIALQQLEIAPNESIYIGDSDVDIEAANAAGTNSVYLSAKRNPMATLCINDFSEILEAVRKIDQN